MRLLRVNVVQTNHIGTELRNQWQVRLELLLSAGGKQKQPF